MDARDVATRLLEDYDARKPGTVFQRADLNLGIHAAYDVQFEVAAMRESRGEQVAGYKTGCISETMQKQLGIDQPVFGHLWNTEVHRSGAQLPADDFDALAIEGEFAVRLRDDVPSTAWLKNNRDVLDRHFSVIELHNYVFHGEDSNRAAELIANNAIHAGVVIPGQKAEADEFNSSWRLQVYRDSEWLGEAVAAHLSTGPLGIVAAVSEHLNHRGLHLKRDQIVLTGSPLPLWRVKPGEAITVRCDGLADVVCRITEAD